MLDQCTLICSSVSDPNPDPWIWGLLIGSGSAISRIRMGPGNIWYSHLIPDKILSVKLFWSLKISQAVQKLWFFTWDPNFWPKYCNFFSLFEQKSTQLWGLITFERLDGFSNFKKVKHSKFWALSIKITWIRIGSGSAKRPGSGSRSGSAPKKRIQKHLFAE